VALSRQWNDADVSERDTGLTQPPYGQQPGGPYPPNQQQPQYQQPGQPPYQYGPPSMAPQQGQQGFGWGPQFAPPGQGYPPQGGFPPGQGYPPGQGFQGPGFQPGWQQQMPPRKKSKAPLFAVLGIVGALVVGLWIFGVIKKNADNNYTQPTTTEPSYRSTPTVPTGEPTATGQPTTTEPTSTTTSEPSGAADLVTLAKNKLYTTGPMRTVNCKEPTVKPSTATNAARYWAEVKPCLERSWARQIALTGYQFRAPGMLFWAGTSVSNPCGASAVSVPFYCPSNHMMYMKVDNFVKAYNEYPGAEDKAYARMWYSRSIAHEYGHAMQSVTGILAASHRVRYELPDSDSRLRQTRRVELQANCLAGVFLGANKRSYPINGLMLQVWNKWVVTSGGKPEQSTHGSKASQAYFMGRSFVTANPASCNTFAASPRNVS
jgi:uncharacterized protein